MSVANRRILCSAVCVLGAVASIGAIARARTNNADLAPVKIAFLVDSFQVERWQTDADSLQKRGKELGAEVVSESADGDDELQLQQAQKLIDSGVRAIVLVAHDTKKAARIVVAAKAKNVSVVCYDRLIPDSDIDYFAGPDYEYVGVLQAAALVKLAPKGNYILVEGSPVDINARLIHEGHLKVLKPYIDRGDIHVVAEVWSKDWNPVEAYAGAAPAIDAAHGEIAAVLAANDGTAGGAIQALEERKLAGKILVSGLDADLAAIIRILNGTQSMTIYKPIGSLAAKAAEVAVSLARKEPVATTDAISDGKKTVPAYFVRSVVVTRENVMETVIKPGFQNLETIKKSVPADKWPR
ncbi:MAG: substrate-binding domain-containing protein [Candidatus Acidiferrum sp.]